MHVHAHAHMNVHGNLHLYLQVYTSTIGVEFMHIWDFEQVNWICIVMCSCTYTHMCMRMCGCDILKLKKRP